MIDFEKRYWNKTAQLIFCQVTNFVYSIIEICYLRKLCFVETCSLTERNRPFSFAAFILEPDHNSKK